LPKTYSALANSPSHKHAKESKKEPITCHAIAGVPLVNPQIRWLNMEVECRTRRINLVTNNVVFLVKKESYHRAFSVDVDVDV
jgi:hypothetical protein